MNSATRVYGVTSEQLKLLDNTIIPQLKVGIGVASRQVSEREEQEDEPKMPKVNNDDGNRCIDKTKELAHKSEPTSPLISN